MSDKSWSGKTGGTHWMQMSLIGLFRHINPVIVYPIVWIWICFYILFVRAGRRGVWHYWHHRLGKSVCSSAYNLYMTYLEFGKVILDRFAAYSGRKIKVSIDGEETLHSLMNQPGGFIVLSSHIGNQELAGYTFHSAKPMYVLSYMGDTEVVNTNRERMFEQMGLHIIPMRQDGSHVLEMHQAISNGNILSIHADRFFYDSKKFYAPVFGQDAAFPAGPFRVAIAEGVPVITLFMMREKRDSYTLYVKQLSDGSLKQGTKTDQAQQLLREYISVTESILHLYPRQWFHFYEFWAAK